MRLGIKILDHFVVFHDFVFVPGDSEMAPVVQKSVFAFLKAKMLVPREKNDVLVFPQGVTPVILGYVERSLHTHDNNPRVQVPAGMLKTPLVQKLAA
jgi:hypothetical protein